MQQLYYIRLQNCPKGNITWRKPNITAKQYNSPKANIAEKNGNRITITVLFWQGHKDLFAFSAKQKIEVRLRPAVGGGALPHRI